MLNRRMTVRAAVAVVLVSTVMYPLFDFAAWFYAGIGAAAVAAGCGALSRLRVLPVAVCLAISVLGLLYYLDVLFEPRYGLLWFIPTPTSARMLWELAGTGLAEAGKSTPPASQMPGLVLLAASGTGITAVLTDLIAVRLRSAALAGLPLLVLFTVPVTMTAPSGAGTVIVFSLGTAGYLAMLSADGRERIRVWGRLVSLWSSSPRHDASEHRGHGRIGPPAGHRSGAGPDTRALAAAGRRIGLASVVLALCVPLLLPGLHPSRPFSTHRGSGGSSGGQAAAALPGALAVTLAELRESPSAKVLAYTTTASPTLESEDAQYLQQYVLDYLSDSGWQVTNIYTGAGQSTTLFAPPGLTVYSVTRPVTTTVTTVAQGALNSPGTPTFLPMPYPPTKVDLSGAWLVGPELMVYSAANDADVGSYRVTSLAVDPTAAQLNAAPPPPLASLAADLQLPSSYRIPALEHIAESITADAHAHTEFAKALALQEWLSGSPFTYDDAGKDFTSAQGLLTYLTKTHVGVCVQSAYAMTVLARLLNIPARMIRGYTTGTRVGKYSYVVTSSDSHVWPEIYFTGYGWMRFEPTPPSSQGNAHAPTYAATPARSGGLTTPSPPPTGPTPSPHATKPGPNNRLRQDQGGGGGQNSQASKSAGSGWAAIVLAILAAIALACGVIAIVAPAGRALSAHAADAHRRSPLTTLAATALAAAAATVALLAVYRVLSHAGLDLRADWATVGIAFGAACAVLLVAPAACRVVLRRWRWALAKDDVSRAHAAWREFRDDLADFGISVQPSEPPRTLAGRVTAGLPEPAREAVRRLALAEERASYAAHPDESVDLRRHGAVARRGIAASGRRGARWRALIFPASVLAVAADGAAMIPEHVTALISRRAAKRRQ
jgi:transglutaminase-like putative cysteine protease